MPVFTAVLGFTFLLFLTACQPQPLRHVGHLPISLPSEAQTYRVYLEGQLRLDDGDYLEAARLFAAAAAAEPGNTALILAQLDALLRAEEDAEALRVAESALLVSPRNIDLILFLGNYHFSREDIPLAISYYQRAYDVDPGQEEGAFHLVLATVKNGDLDRAISLLTAMLERQPEGPAAELMLARVYREQGNLSKAEEILHRLERRLPELDAPVLELGALFERREDWDAAIGYYRRAVNLNPENLAIRHHLALLYIQKDDLASAQAEFSEILMQNPGDLEARRKIGLIHMERKEYSSAVSVFKSLIESAPELDEVRFYLGNAYELQGDLLLALPHFEAVSEHAEIYSDALMHRVFILNKLQHLSEAIELLEERLTRVDANHEIYLYLASLYEQNGQRDQVLETLSRTRQRFMDNADLAYRLGLLFERQHSPETAIAEMRRAIGLDPNHAEALNYLAYYYAERRENLDEALDMAKRALALKDETHILDTLGWVFFVRGDFVGAEKFLGQAVERGENDPVVLEHYGDVLRAKKDYKEAAVIYQRSLAVQPENDSLRDKLKMLLPVKMK